MSNSRVMVFPQGPWKTKKIVSSKQDKLSFTEIEAIEQQMLDLLQETTDM